MRITLALLPAAWCAATTTASHAPTWQVVWSDEFTGPAGPPDASIWNVASHGGFNGSNHEVEWYSPAAVQLDGLGHLVLTTAPVSPPVEGWAQYTSGWVDTQGKRFTRPSVFPIKWEIRAQLPGGQGIWPAHWRESWAGVWRSVLLPIARGPDGSFFSVESVPWGGVPAPPSYRLHPTHRTRGCPRTVVPGV